MTVAKGGLLGKMLARAGLPLLRALPPELAHHLGLTGLATLPRLGLRTWLPEPVNGRRGHRCMGLDFPNPLGLAAGMDKNGDYLDALFMLGFGFVELGTVTPEPQPGNPRPRLFRVQHAQALINRMGFNNKGVDHLARRLQEWRRRSAHTVVGVSIGKGFATPLEHALEDFLHCLERIYVEASYVAVNLSSPNTPLLRQLQEPQWLEHLLAHLDERRRELVRKRGGVPLPLLLKVDPDQSAGQLTHIAKLLRRHRWDGVIATNTTLSRQGVQGRHAGQSGGVSGVPLAGPAQAALTALAKGLDGTLPIIACGGIMDAAGARQRMAQGASLLQIYTGLVYQGPGLVPEIVAALNAADGHSNSSRSGAEEDHPED